MVDTTEEHLIFTSETQNCVLDHILSNSRHPKMVKRVREDDGVEDEPPSKRIRPCSIDRLSSLSDELILRVLSHLPVSNLVVCQRLSHKYHTLAGDSQLWKSHYYNRFVRPRASRLPGIRDADDASGSLHFASKASRWLDDEHLVRRGAKTNWKKHYKLRSNWSRGSCAVNEIEVAEQAAVPPVLVEMHDGVIFMADQTDGLRAWSAKGERRMIAQIRPGKTCVSPPTSLALEAVDGTEDTTNVIVGYEDGSFTLYALRSREGRFVQRYSHEPSSNGVVSAVALRYPYAVTMTATQRLSLYRFQTRDHTDDRDTLDNPRLLHSLKSHTVWPPLSTCLRLAGPNILISIAYALPTYLSGWTVGIQELRLSPTGGLLSSRLASAIDQHYRPLAFSTAPTTFHLPPSSPASPSPGTAAPEIHHIHSKPTSLSYTHPYLLVAHPDNTLTLYLVASTPETLSLSPGSRLWGHTSSVSGAHVGDRGRAVSISRRGDELRVWELEGGFASSAARKRLAMGALSVQVRPEQRGGAGEEARQAGLDFVHGKDGVRVGEGEEEETAAELTLTRGWIGFDDENVVVLKERGQGRQALVVYDFT